MIPWRQQHCLKPASSLCAAALSPWATLQVTRILDQINVHHQVFYHVAPDPTLECIEEGLAEVKEFRRAHVARDLGGGQRWAGAAGCPLTLQ